MINIHMQNITCRVRVQLHMPEGGNRVCITYINVFKAIVIVRILINNDVIDMNA
jgi:hypothetical protein